RSLAASRPTPPVSRRPRRWPAWGPNRPTGGSGPRPPPPRGRKKGRPEGGLESWNWVSVVARAARRVVRLLLDETDLLHLRVARAREHLGQHAVVRVFRGVDLQRRLVVGIALDFGVHHGPQRAH